MAPRIPKARPRIRKPKRINKTPKAKISFHNYNINSEYQMHPEIAKILREYFKKYPISYYAGEKIGPFRYFLESLKSTGLDRDINKILASNSPRKAEEIEHRLRIDIYLEHVFGFKYLPENIKQNAFELIFRIMLKEHLIALNGNPTPKPPRTSVGITNRNKEADRDIVKTLDDYPTHIGNRREVIDPRQEPQEAIPFSYPDREYQGPVTKGRELVKFSNPRTQEHQNPEIDTSAPIIQAERELLGGIEEILGKTKKQTKKTRTQIVTEFLKDKIKRILDESTKQGKKIKGKAEEIDLEALKKFLITQLRTISRRNPKLINEEEIIKETIRSVNNLSQTKHRINTNEIIEPQKDPWTRSNYPEIEKPGELKNLPARIPKKNTSLERFVIEPKERQDAIDKIVKLSQEDNFKLRVKNYEKKFENITNINISQAKVIASLLRLINPEKILELAKEINFATRHSKTMFTKEQIYQLEQLSLKYEKFAKAILLIKGNEKKFMNLEVQELLFWLKRKDVLESDNLENFINEIIHGKRYAPENIDLESWKLLNEFADVRNLFGLERINYLERTLSLTPERFLEALKEIKKLLIPKRKNSIKAKPLEPIGEKGIFDELTEALKNENFDKVIEYVRKNTTINRELEPTLKSALELNLRIKRLAKSKNINELIENFDIDNFQKEYDNLIQFVNNKKNMDIRNIDLNFYSELKDLATKSRLLLDSIKIIIENKSRFIGKDFKKLLEILKNPQKISDLDHFIHEILEREVKEEPTIKYDPSVEEPMDIKPEELTEVQENPETTLEKQKRNMKFKKFLKQSLPRRFKKQIQEFISNNNERVFII